MLLALISNVISKTSFGINKTENKLYVGIRDAAYLQVIDLDSREVIKTLPVHGGIHNVYVTKDDKWIVAGLGVHPKTLERNCFIIAVHLVHVLTYGWVSGRPWQPLPATSPIAACCAHPAHSWDCIGPMGIALTWISDNISKTS